MGSSRGVHVHSRWKGVVVELKPRCIDCNVELVGLGDAEREAVIGHPRSSKGWAQYIICPDCGTLHRPNGISVWAYPYGKMLIVDDAEHNSKKVLWEGW